MENACTWLSAEVKTRKRLPAWLLAAVQQARANARASRLPIIVLHQLGSRHDGDLVVMTLAGFTDWFGDDRPQDVRSSRRPDDEA